MQATDPSCQRFRIFIEMRLHGVLSPEEAATLDLHLATCEACGSYLAAAERLREALRERGRGREVHASGDASMAIRQALVMARRRTISDAAIELIGPVLLLGVMVLRNRFTVSSFLAMAAMLSFSGWRWMVARQKTARYAAIARGSDDLLALVRREVEDSIRWARRARWLGPSLAVFILACVIYLLRAGATAPPWVVLLLLGACMGLIVVLSRAELRLRLLQKEMEVLK